MKITNKLIFYVMSAFISCLILYSSALHTDNVKINTIERAAKSYSNAVTLFRAFYSKDILDIVKDSKLRITHDFHNHQGAFPLPATMTHELSKFALEHGDEVSFSMTSEFPFPWRESRLLSEFQKRALSAIQNGDTSYTEIIHTDGLKSLHYADPVYLEASCVGCHNEHPDTPKTNWHIGDIRGIQEVIIPIADDAFKPSWSLVQLISLVMVMLLLSFITIHLLFKFLANKNETLAIVKQRTQDLEKSYEQLALTKTSEQKAIKEKSQLLAAMGHEIRTPLNGIIGLINLIEDVNLSIQQKKDIESVRNCSTALVQIINDILDFSKIESGKMKINATPFNPEVLAEDVCKLFRAKADHNGIELKTISLAPLPKVLIGDESKIRQILFNLMGNAIKFTAKGHVHIILESKLIDEAQCLLTFTVEDTGVGISPGCIDSVFNVFEQAENQCHSQFSGTGLGLSISKKLANIMSGDITCTSELNKGSRFICHVMTTIGKAESKDSLSVEPIAWSNNPELEAQFQNINILVAEDNVVNQQVICRMLKNFGFQVHLAEDGEKAIQLWQTDHHDIILMDVEMPILNGHEASQKIRDICQDPDQPIIIALTANSDANDQKECFKFGMNDFLSKPFKPNNLKEKLFYHCQAILSKQ